MSEKTIQHTFWQTFWFGGCSIIFCLGFWAFMERTSSVYTVSFLALTLAFVINYPHFLSSYILLYSELKSQILKKPSYFWAAIAVPVILLGVIATALLQRNALLMGYLVHAMFFSVGWHYVKQIFGCVIVASVHENKFLNLLQRRVLLLNLYSLWMVSWVPGQTTTAQFSFYTTSYIGLGLPSWLVTIAYVLFWTSFIALVGLFTRQYIQTGKKPAPAAIAAVLALYVWYIPFFAHPGFAYLIPFFHSLQYLAIVWVLKKNQTEDNISELPPQQQRQKWVVHFIGFFALAAVLGATFFEWIPQGLDAYIDLQIPELGRSIYLVCFLLFINIHHYFIDNVIWRSSNETVRKYVFTP